MLLLLLMVCDFFLKNFCTLSGAVLFKTASVSNKSDRIRLLLIAATAHLMRLKTAPVSPVLIASGGLFLTSLYSLGDTDKKLQKHFTSFHSLKAF